MEIGRTGMPGLALYLILLFCLLTGYSEQTFATPDHGNSAKASYLLHLSTFIEWPASGKTAKTTTFNICLTGDSENWQPFLDLQGKATKGQEVEVLLITTINELDSCHLVFVAGHKRPYQDTIIQTSAQKKILSVGESELFVKAGGMIGLIFDKHDQGKLRCVINQEISEEVGFGFSAQLLEVAVLL